MTRSRASLVLLALFGVGCDEVISEAHDMAADGGPPPFLAADPPVGAEHTNFYGAHGSAADNLLFVGSGGTIVRWDGMRLALEDSGTKEDLRGVFVVSREIAWAAGAKGTLVRYGGQKWTTQDAKSTAYFNAVWSDGAKMLAVGVKGAAVAYDGAFKPVPTDSPDDLFAIAATKDGLFAVGTLGTIASYDGEALHRSALQGFSKTLSAATVGPKGAWVVGLGGAVFHSASGNGDDLEAIAGVPPVFLRGVAAPQTGAWIVGFDGVVARVIGSKVAVLVDVPDRWYEAVWGASDDDVWIAGNAGTLLRSNRGAFSDGGISSDGGARDGAGP